MMVQHLTIPFDAVTSMTESHVVIELAFYELHSSPEETASELEATDK